MAEVESVSDFESRDLKYMRENSRHILFRKSVVEELESSSNPKFKKFLERYEDAGGIPLFSNSHLMVDFERKPKTHFTVNSFRTYSEAIDKDLQIVYIKPEFEADVQKKLSEDRETYEDYIDEYKRMFNDKYKRIGVMERKGDAVEVYHSRNFGEVYNPKR